LRLSFTAQDRQNGRWLDVVPDGLELSRLASPKLVSRQSQPPADRADSIEWLGDKVLLVIAWGRLGLFAAPAEPLDGEGGGDQQQRSQHRADTEADIEE
jgi:hypothetical protein